MNISFSSVFASIIFSSVGLWLFTISKRKANFPVIVLSMVLMSYTYFTEGPWLDWGVGFGLCAIAYFLWE